MTKKLLVNFVSKVNASGIRRETRGGHEYVIVPSRTLPADTVMNGGLYPKTERDASFNNLEGTHAPIGHPKDTDGNYISATDAKAVALNFSIGAVNENVRLNEQLDVIELDKAIPVSKAMETDKGRDLLNRINMLEKGKGDPIHTSTGVFLEVEQLDAPRVNEAGDEYTWIASNMQWDHDAILLNEIGANQPHQKVGMFTNSSGEECEAIQVNLEIEYEINENTPENSENDGLLSKIAKLVNSAFANKEKDNYNKIDLNINNKVDPMRENMIAALSAKGISVNAEISDAELLAKYNETLAANAGDVKSDKLQAVVNSIAALTDKIADLEQKANKKQDAEKAVLVAKVVANKEFGLDEDAAKAMPVAALTAMANSIKPEYKTDGLNSTFNTNSETEAWTVGADE
jgi:hypothetical protein